MVPRVTLFEQAVPATPDVNDSGSVVPGVKFSSTSAGKVRGVRFYKAAANKGTHAVGLWGSTGTLLAQATVSGETTSGWQEANFASPVSISASTTYVAGYLAPKGHYSANSQGFSHGDEKHAANRAGELDDAERGLHLQRLARFPDQLLPGDQLLGRRPFHPMSARSNTPATVSTPLAALALTALAVALGGCGGGTDAAAETVTQTEIVTATFPTGHDTDEVSASGAKQVPACELVTKHEAEAILGAGVAVSERPQGPDLRLRRLRPPGQPGGRKGAAESAPRRRPQRYTGDRRRSPRLVPALRNDRRRRRRQPGPGTARHRPLRRRRPLRRQSAAAHPE